MSERSFSVHDGDEVAVDNSCRVTDGHRVDERPSTVANDRAATAHAGPED